MISFEQNVFQALEFMPGRILVSLWEPGYLVIDRVTGQGLFRINDPIPTNINCRGFWPVPGFDPEKYPFVIARNQVAFNLINVKTGFAQTLIRDVCDSNWYQDTFVVVGVSAMNLSTDLASSKYETQEGSAYDEFDVYYVSG